MKITSDQWAEEAKMVLQAFYRACADKQLSPMFCVCVDTRNLEAPPVVLTSPGGTEEKIVAALRNMLRAYEQAGARVIPPMGGNG